MAPASSPKSPLTPTSPMSGTAAPDSAPVPTPPRAPKSDPPAVSARIEPRKIITVAPPHGAPPESRDEPTVRDRVPSALSRPPPAPEQHVSDRPLAISVPPPQPPEPHADSEPPSTQPYRDRSGELSEPRVHAAELAHVAEIVVEHDLLAELPPEPPPPPEPPRPLRPSGSRGASQPPYQSEPPSPINMPMAAPLPHEVRRSGPEPAEHLSLPPGLHGSAPPPRDYVPSSVIEARIAFTHLSRELGREYRASMKVELRTDTEGIELMQRFMRERFAGGMPQTPDDWHELKRHGAFMSEILARRLGAHWVDIGPTELGYWAMIVPGGSGGARVWPFGRVLRFVAMGHKERDLVSYYLELQARAAR
jgi:hypothetical protein